MEDSLSFSPEALHYKDLKFKCPNCGGSEFGSTIGAAPLAQMQGVCHGIKENENCGFRWDRKYDKLYFVKNTQTKEPRGTSSTCRAWDRMADNLEQKLNVEVVAYCKPDTFTIQDVDDLGRRVPETEVIIPLWLAHRITYL